MAEYKPEECTCDDHEYDFHPCPFTEDIDGETIEDECNCCPECTEQCAQSI